MTSTRAMRRVPVRRGPLWNGLAFLLALVACTACGPVQPEAIDSANLAGRWVLDTGEETEWFHLQGDGTFSAHIRQDNFIATTLNQGPHVEVSGHWSLADRTLTFTIDDSDDEAMVGVVRSYEIEELTDRELVTVDSQGKRTRLVRGL